MIADIYVDSRVPHDVYRPTFVKSLAMVPVRAPDAIAAIGAYWADHHEAAEEEVGAMTLLADSIALALRNVELYDELSVALRREKEARCVAEAATGSKDEFLALVAHELRQPLHASLAALRMMSTGPGAVSDTGRGIDPAAISTIFTLFARAASDVRGFGVGLAATRRLVELHGGTIQARSDGAGRGAQFRVSLPLAIGV